MPLKNPRGTNGVSLGEAVDKKKAPEKKPVDLSKLTIIVADRGTNTHLAQFLARYFGKVKYRNLNSSIYPRSIEAQIGKGLPGIEWIDSIQKHKKKADLIFFPYIYDEEIQEDLRSQGYPVCGSGRGAKMELDKYYFYSMVEKVGLPVPYTYRAEGLDEALEYCIKHEDRRPILKYAERYRGDFESYAYKNRYAAELFINEIKFRIGPERAKEVDVLCQSYVEGIETGVDPFMLDGEMPKWSDLGFEVKDNGYIAKAVESFPEIVQSAIDPLKPIYKALGYRGAYSNEMRIAPDGNVYRTDDTARVGCPVGGCVPEMYGESYARAIYSLAHGEMPVLKPEHPYGAEIKIESPWNIENQLHIGCPKGFEKHLKLQCATMKGGQYYIIPDPVEGSMDFGSVVGFGKTLKEAQQMALDAIEELTVFQLLWDKSIFDETGEIVEKANKFLGITF